MRRIGKLLVLAGPTACGKSTFLDKVSAPEWANLGARLGLGPIGEWPRMAANRLALSPDLDLKYLTVHHDFLWPPRESSVEKPGGSRALAILEGAGEVTLVTLWTPAERLEAQLVHGKLRSALPYSLTQIFKAGAFLILPGFALRRLSDTKLVNLLTRRFPDRALFHHLRLLRTYSSAEKVTALYRRWLEFCDMRMPMARAHLVVEFNERLKIYSRDEWEHRVRELTGG